jgi:uncharacterized metal-binding protein YceD (DUF177 family)
MDYYKIKLTGIKDGVYSNSFEIKNEFFEAFSQTEISSADIIAKTCLIKTDRKTTLEVEITGVINNIPCDICTEEIQVPISSKMSSIIQEGKTEENLENEIIYIDKDENDLCIRNYLYEMIVLAIPTKRRHQLNSINQSECNKEMVDLINKYSSKNKKTTDPRWEALKDIKLK